jgi:hypothetical protein
VIGLPQRARPRRAGRALDAGTLLEAVGQRRLGELAGRAQPGEEVVGAAAGQRAAQERNDAAAERGVADADPAVERERDLELAEDLRDERRVVARLAQDDRDVLGREAAFADQAGDMGGDELEFGALAPAFEQLQRVAGVGPLRARAVPGARSARRGRAARRARARAPSAPGRSRRGRRRRRGPARRPARP